MFILQYEVISYFYVYRDVSIIYSFGSTININSSTVSNITLINHAIIAVSTSLCKFSCAYIYQDITNITASEVSNRHLSDYLWILCFRFYICDQITHE